MAPRLSGLAGYSAKHTSGGIMMSPPMWPPHCDADRDGSCGSLGGWDGQIGDCSSATAALVTGAEL